MGMEYGFFCKFCGKGFGNNPDKLDTHINSECMKAKEKISN